jgi:hypothetical protein
MTKWRTTVLLAVTGVTAIFNFLQFPALRLSAQDKADQLGNLWIWPVNVMERN